ncbi:MAG TPA: septum site-determining protein MinC [Clostridia bacterium]|nr:septum site-determining protein MinC [Clostridia bacterium]
MNSNLINIKGTRDGLIIIFDTSQEFELIKKHLLLKMESAKGFFKGAKFALYDRERIPSNQKHELEAICCNYGLVPSAETPKPLHGTVTDNNRGGGLTVQKPTIKGLKGKEAIIVRSNLRGGQKVSHPSNVVILGNVHPGAEIFAGGNIIIMGNCHGQVHAGTYGDKKARVTAFRLAPAIISIAGVLARSTQKNKTPNSYPEMAFLQNDKIIIKRYR